MYERILGPLDGSQLAETALPYAEELAGRLGSEVTLLYVSEPIVTFSSLFSVKDR
jgi:nucleotide-binding universal stress UspA family protein